MPKPQGQDFEGVAFIRYTILTPGPIVKIG